MLSFVQPRHKRRRQCSAGAVAVVRQAKCKTSKQRLSELGVYTTYIWLDYIHQNDYYARAKMCLVYVCQVAIGNIND